MGIGFLWGPSGNLMGGLWVSHWKRQEAPRESYGNLVGTRWEYAIWESMGTLSVSFGYPLGTLWEHHGNRMGIIWDSSGNPLGIVGEQYENRV